jgi:hypothetical protein
MNIVISIDIGLKHFASIIMLDGKLEQGLISNVSSKDISEKLMDVVDRVTKLTEVINYLHEESIRIYKLKLNKELNNKNIIFIIERQVVSNTKCYALMYAVVSIISTSYPLSEIIIVNPKRKWKLWETYNLVPSSLNYRDRKNLSTKLFIAGAETMTEMDIMDKYNDKLDDIADCYHHAITECFPELFKNKYVDRIKSE